MCQQATTFPPVQVVSETIPALLKLKEEGLVRHIGITGLPLKIYPYVLDRYRGCLDKQCGIFVQMLRYWIYHA